MDRGRLAGRIRQRQAGRRGRLQIGRLNTSVMRDRIATIASTKTCKAMSANGSRKARWPYSTASSRPKRPATDRKIEYVGHARSHRYYRFDENLQGYVRQWIEEGSLAVFDSVKQAEEAGYRSED